MRFNWRVFVVAVVVGPLILLGAIFVGSTLAFAFEFANVFFGQGAGLTLFAVVFTIAVGIIAGFVAR